LPDIRTFRSLDCRATTAIPLADEITGDVTRCVSKLKNLFASEALKPVDFLYAGVRYEGIVDRLNVLDKENIKGRR